MRKTLFLLFAVALFAACSNDIIYSRFVPIPTGEWSLDSVARFDYAVADKDAGYNVVLYVRHTERYPYQNMWVFTNDNGRCDTIEFYLADDRGRWLGDKRHGFIEMPVLLEDSKHFADTGQYFLEVRHGMRDTLLRGVTDIGLEIRRNE